MRRIRHKFKHSPKVICLLTSSSNYDLNTHQNVFTHMSVLIFIIVHMG